MYAGVAEVSDSECSDEEVADDDDNDDDDVLSASANSQHQPLLQHTDPTGRNHLSRQARQALKHLHTVDNNVRTVVSAVASSRTLYRGKNSVIAHPRRQDSMLLWSRIRWWVIAIGTTFIIVPVIFVLYMKLVRTGS